MLLAIETSCDETAVAILDPQKFFARAARSDYLLADLISSQISLHEPYGGVVPELAAREHLTNLPPLIDLALKQAGLAAADLKYIAVTRGPGLNGCLLVGLSYAKALAYAAKIPLLAVNHLEAHLFAHELAEPRTEIKYPALALLVSGGHTELIHLRDFRQYEYVTRTRDDAVGEAFDKSATLLGLSYPGGPALAARAAKGDRDRFSFPIGMPDDDTAFSFSGVKTAVRRAVEEHSPIDSEQLKNDLAAGIEYALVDALVRKVHRAAAKIRPRSVLLTGGVAANSLLRERLRSELQAMGIEFLVPPLRWCTDNAAMIGVLALRLLDSSSGQLSPQQQLETGSLPRWPLDQLS